MNGLFQVGSVAETWQVAAAVAKVLQPGMVVALYGDLGSGKTTLVQGLGAALGVQHPITSPTFVISVEHPTAHFLLVHMDLYRLGGADDLLEIGFLEYLERGAVVVVEWPERALELLPPDTLHVRLDLERDSEARRIEIWRNLTT